MTGLISDRAPVGHAAAAQRHHAHQPLGDPGDLPHGEGGGGGRGGEAQLAVGHRRRIARGTAPRAGGEQGDRDDGADHAHQVGQPVAHGRGLPAGELVRQRHRRRRGERTRPHADRRRQVQVEQRGQRVHREGGEDHHDDGGQHQGQVAAQVPEEHLAGAEPDQVGEEGQAEALEQGQPVADVGQHRPDEQAHEQCPRGAEADLAQGDGADGGAQGDGGHEDEDGLVVEQREHGRVSVLPWWSVRSGTGRRTSPGRASAGTRPGPPRPRPSCRPCAWPRRRRPAGRPCRRREG